MSRASAAERHELWQQTLETMVEPVNRALAMPTGRWLSPDRIGVAIEQTLGTDEEELVRMLKEKLDERDRAEARGGPDDSYVASADGGIIFLATALAGRYLTGRIGEYPDPLLPELVDPEKRADMLRAVIALWDQQNRYAGTRSGTGEGTTFGMAWHSLGDPKVRRILAREGTSPNDDLEVIAEARRLFQSQYPQDTIGLRQWGDGSIRLVWLRGMGGAISFGRGRTSTEALADAVERGGRAYRINIAFKTTPAAQRALRDLLDNLKRSATTVELDLPGTGGRGLATTVPLQAVEREIRVLGIARYVRDMWEN